MFDNILSFELLRWYREICILKPKKRLEIQQFVEPGYENGKNNERIEIFENKAIRNLKRLLYANREALMKGLKGLMVKIVVI